MAATISLTGTRAPLAFAACVAVSLAWSSAADAEFNLDWTQDGNPAFNTLGCTTPAECSVILTDPDTGIESTIPGQTPFLYETTSLDGQQYYHMIIGDPDANFAQEVYIRVGTTDPFLQPFNQGPDLDGDGLPTASSSSLGEFDAQVGDPGNGIDPLGQDSDFTGNSSGNPQRVQMRQLVTDGELTVDFVKGIFLDKPSITNTIDTVDLNATFIMDSTGNRYNDNSTPSVVTNTVEILDPDIPATSALFDMATDAQDSSLTAGRYTFNPSGSAQFGGAGGTYQYIDGGANLNPDWASFFDHNEPNPWTYEDRGNRPTEP